MPDLDVPDDPQPGALHRRRFLQAGAALGAAGLVTTLRSDLMALARAALPDSGYGALRPPDEHGVSLPRGFSSRLVGRSGDIVAGTGYVWPWLPDGGACFPAANGFGHTYVANSEVPRGGGGVSAVDVDADGRVVAARRILAGTSTNCSGGATPWGTWLSCEEEHPNGRVWECDPRGGPAVVRPALGVFAHEAIAVHAGRREVFLTEDRPDGRLYRFRPDRWRDLSSGVLQAASVTDGVVSWVDVDASRPERSDATTSFDGGEGIVIDGKSLFFATKGDRRVWELRLDTSRLTVFHDCVARPDTALDQVDNLTIHPTTRHLFVAEDRGDMDLCMLVRGPGDPIVTRMVRFIGHAGSEVSGPAFSPDGNFLYVSSQRGVDGLGVTVQIRGPFIPWIEQITDSAQPRRGAVRLNNAREVPGP